MTQSKNNIFNVAHRGASSTCPENTILAFNTAWENNADICEGDFHLTKDKVIVCIHDKDTLRVSGKKLVISESNYTDLLKINVAHHFDKEMSEQIPTLEQVLNTVPINKTFLIEVKSGIEIIPKLMSILNDPKFNKIKFGVISFDKEVLRQVKDNNIKIITLLLNDIKNKMSNDTIKSNLLDINANGLLTNKIDGKMREEVESLKLIYNIWSSDPDVVAKH